MGMPDEPFHRFFVQIQTSDEAPFFPRSDDVRAEVDRIVVAIQQSPYQRYLRHNGPGVYEIEIHVPKK